MVRRGCYSMVTPFALIAPLSAYCSGSDRSSLRTSLPAILVLTAGRVQPPPQVTSHTIRRAERDPPGIAQGLWSTSRSAVAVDYLHSGGSNSLLCARDHGWILARHLPKCIRDALLDAAVALLPPRPLFLPIVLERALCAVAPLPLIRQPWLSWYDVSFRN